jgi:GNAT superfamily N-acetyltransferase
MHEDIIDGDPNSFITAFYVRPTHRRRGIGTLLLDRAIRDSLERGAVGVETSTIHANAKRLYEKMHFKQTIGDIAEVFLELDLTEYLPGMKSLRTPERDSQ